MQSKLIHYPLVINDTRLRQDAAASAARLLRRLDRLTQARDDFYGLDQQLFADWYQLTFREELSRRDALERSVLRLRETHAAVFAYAHFAGVDVDEAYSFLEEEKVRYELGSAEEKKRIEDARLYRARNAPGRQKAARAEAREKRKAKAEENAAREWWRWYESLEPAQIRAIAENEDVATNVDLLLAGILAGNTDGQIAAGLRFWDATSAQVRKKAGQRFAEQNSGELEDLVAFLKRRDDTPPPHEPGESLSAPARPTREEEHLKLLYRKFVRYLHPDARGPGAKSSEWQMTMWHRGQEAYQAGNLPALHALYRVIMLRLGKLGELTMEEIREIAAGLEAEFKSLQRETKAFKKAPFWKFSARKDYGDLVRKIGSGLRDAIEILGAEESGLREEVRVWALLAEGRKGRPTRPGKKRGRR